MNRLRDRLQRSVALYSAALISLAVIPATPVPAQTTPTTLRVETLAVAPFVIERNGALTGFSIELWEEIAGRLKVKWNYQKAPGVAVFAEAVRSKQADVGVSSVFITEERDREFDFSHPILEAGQQVMVRDTGESATSNPLRDLILLLFSTTTLLWLGIAVLFMLVPAHLMWLLERRRKDGILPTEKYFPGIFHAMHWSATTLVTQAEQTPRQPLARVLSFLLMFTGVVFVALYTAQLTATLTVQQIRGPINGPEDLPGKRVGTGKDSVSVDYLRKHNAQIQEFAQMDDMVQALLDKKVDALLLLAPPLRYYAAHEGKGLVRMVGPEFNKGEIAFVFPDNSPLRKPINGALLGIREDGTYQRIYEEWFGNDQ